jgi:iron complex transport system ATP-binding protein
LGAGEFTAIVGPNGAGKSTLLSILAGLRPEYRGECIYEGTEMRRWPRRKLARRLSLVPQSLELQFPFTAEQVVLMGRTPHCDGLFDTPEDFEAVARAMELTDTTQFRDRDIRTLSGGERQRVVLASALAQSPRVLLLDEPTTFLDLKHQFSVYKLLAGLAREGLLVLAATHDLNLAAGYCGRVVVLDRGRVAADGPPAEALGPETIREVFEVEACIEESGGRPRIRYAE